MSFSSNTKSEICKIKTYNFIKKKYQMYGMLLFSKSFSYESIVLTTKQLCVKDIIVNLITELTGSIVDVFSRGVSKTRVNNDFVISIPNKCDRIRIINEFYKDFNYIDNKIVLNKNIDKNIIHFLRGVFLTCGAITNPNINYRLEFIIENKLLVVFLKDVLLNVKNIFFNIHTTLRKEQYVLYIKESESIADFLTYIGASVSSMELMQVKMLKEVINYVNRTTNFQTANLCKTATAAAIQIDAIENIKNEVGLDFLQNDLKELAQLRLENPDMSLRELGELLSIPLSRSGVNHRLKRIIEISKDI